MAIRNDFAPGEVLAAADLNDTFGSKPTKTFATTAPGSPTTGDIWYDTNSTPPLAKFWDGSAWQVFSAGAANFSNAATGTYTDGGISYKYVTFNSSGTLTVTKAGFADVLVIGGGGGGGRRMAGGGGAGGHLFAADLFLPAASLTITVGSGGAPGGPRAQNWPSGLNGNASAIGSWIVAPGGGGGGGSDLVGGNGGSGGGGGHGSNAGGAAFAPQGNDGGSSITNYAGGGGGAGAVGSNASGSNAGSGGAGTANSITGTSVTRGGGGGGGSQGGTAGTGGSGGGGAGTANNNTATSGTANTGGGGGGGGLATGDGGIGGNGGSGVVIVRVRT